ncbi:MAG: type IX secretion system outer membrane channel protein PorV [Mucilaginibacter sp.]|uniref:type IX secretion system outer membrane channel protein PorV n=1 Tax=Mucilaginibacter sp. TaxID=1882438 RepID=UPI0031B311C5
MRFFGFKLCALLIVSYSMCCNIAQAQVVFNTNGSNNTALPTAVPFLTISPDARSGAMGEAGVAISPDANSVYWNAAKLPFLEDKSTVSLSYSPWLRKLVSDINLAYLSYAQKLTDRNSLGFSLRYFNLGTINLVDENLISQGTYNPSEFSVDGTFARKFGEELSLGLTLRYIHSGLYSGFGLTAAQSNPVNAVSADVSLFSTHNTVQFNKDAIFSFGANISNIGTKVNYSRGGPQLFLPANLKVGIANTLFLDDVNKVTFALDLNKFLVPTPPIRDSVGNIIKGRDDSRSVVSGILGSFTDAPGGLKEELQEINYSTGLEYWYNNKFALRAGYFYENPNKGNRSYVTLGFGLVTNNLNIDFSYLAASQDKSPLANTLRFSLGYKFGSTSP